MSATYFPFPDSAVEFGSSATNVTGATVMEAFTATRIYVTGAYTVENGHASNALTMSVEFSHRGTYPDDSMAQTLIVQPLKEGTVAWGEAHKPGADYVRLTVTPSSGTIPVRWRRRGVYRGP